MSRKMKRQVFLAVFSICALITVLVSYLQCRHTHHYEALGKKRLTSSEKKEVVEYDRSMPLIFIGGVPRSGTTLMRAMLDAHSHVRCGEETRLVPRLLSLKSNWFKSELESKRLREAGITHDVVNDAVASFILEIIVKHGEPAPRLCNKDPFTLRYSLYLNQLFPNGKYLLMIRDGRAVVHSIISRKITITGFNLNSYKQCLEKWNGAIEIMYHQCLQLGSRTCLLVYYEQLVLQPERWLQKIVRFLDLPWDDAMLHHQDFVGKKGGISLSKRERSSDQVIKPVYHEALTKWVGNIPPDVADHMDTIAPMLRTLGYDPHANPPNYGVPDNVVSQKHPDQNDEQRRREDEGENNHNFLPYTE